MSELEPTRTYSNLTATEVLRRLLDERGVEYETPHAGFTIVRTDNAVCKFYETLEEPERGVFAVVTTDWLTPEQAIAVTLGRGECHDLAETPSYRDKTEFKCSECGYEYSAVGGFGCDSGDEPDFNYCPNCGRRVEQ